MKGISYQTRFWMGYSYRVKILSRKRVVDHLWIWTRNLLSLSLPDPENHSESKSGPYNIKSVRSRKFFSHTSGRIFTDCHKCFLRKDLSFATFLCWTPSTVHCLVLESDPEWLFVSGSGINHQDLQHWPDMHQFPTHAHGFSTQGIYSYVS
jgi:hypothetical protein